MAQVCVDASLVLRWLLPDEPQQPVISLWESWRQDAVEVIAPPLLPAEIVSGLWQAVRRGRVSPERGDTLLEEFGFLGIRITDDDGLLPLAWSLVKRYSSARTYNLQYLALASLTQCPLWTADQRFFSRVHDDWPHVHVPGEAMDVSNA